MTSYFMIQARQRRAGMLLRENGFGKVQNFSQTSFRVGTLSFNIPKDTIQHGPELLRFSLSSIVLPGAGISPLFEKDFLAGSFIALP